VDEVKNKIENITLPKRFSRCPVLIHANGLIDTVQDSGYFSSLLECSS